MAIYNEKYISTITNTIEYLNNISATVNMDKNTSQKTQNQQDTGNCNTTTNSSTKYGCTCTCYQKNITRRICVIFIKKNYNFDNKKIADVLSNRYHECNNK